MKYQTMPPLAREDADALERSIRTHGVQVAIIVDENGDVIDGHHRKEIADRCGIYLPVEVRDYLDESQKVALSISLNMDRRQLTREQKRDVIAKSLKAEPEASNREHARRTGADHKTVDAVRGELESGGEIPHLTERINPQGRTQPASKPTPVVSITTKETTETTESYDANTGEVIEPVSLTEADVERLADADRRVQDSGYMRQFYKAMSMDWSLFDAARIAHLADDRDMRTIEIFASSATEFYEKVRRARSGLRLIQGGKK